MVARWLGNGLPRPPGREVAAKGPKGARRMGATGFAVEPGGRWWPCGGREVSNAGRGDRGVRPRDGGPGQGHTAPSADSLLRPAPRPGAESAPLGRAARPQFPRRGDGPGGGVAGPSGRRAGPGYLWKETARFSPLPCRLEQFAAAQQITISGLWPPRRHQAPALASSRRARSGTAPRGGARRHGCGTWEPAPAAPYGKMAAPTSPAPAARCRPPAHPWLQAPGGALPAASGVGGGQGPPGRSLCTETWHADPVRTARWPRRRVRDRGGLMRSLQGFAARLLLLSPPRRVSAGVFVMRAGGRWGADSASPILRVRPRRT